MNLKKFKKFIIIFLAVSLMMSSAVYANAETNDRTLILGGMPFGMKLFSNGVIVVNVDDSFNSPALRAGIQVNDIITEAKSEKITTNEQLKEIIENSEGEDIELSVFRGKSPISLTITPQKDDDEGYIAGMWIRDSTAGIGTVTYFDERTMSFGALGHGICDRDTGLLIPLSKGEIYESTITGVNKGRRGFAGGLTGYMGDDPIGEITLNNDFGIYGRYHQIRTDRRILCANDSEIKTGEASIFTTIDNAGVKEYTVNIETVNPSDVTGQNMIIRVTDQKLLEKTGGIIQGMSGSPIVQDGKLIGAVTHVFVNSPEKGYGISVSNMLKNYETYAKY